MKLGYARVSRIDQNLEPQTDALKAAGADHIFTDKISGAKAKRAGFDDLLKQAREGDVLIVWRLDRLARSLQNLLDISAELQRRGIQLISLSEGIDTTSTAGKLVFHIFGSIAEFERNIIIDRTHAGLEAARARGKKGGRKPALNPEQYQLAVKLISEGRTAGKEDSEIYRETAQVLHCSERTIRRVAAGEYSAGNRATASAFHVKILSK